MGLNLKTQKMKTIEEGDKTYGFLTSGILTDGTNLYAYNDIPVDGYFVGTLLGPVSELLCFRAKEMEEGINKIDILNTDKRIVKVRENLLNTISSIKYSDDLTLGVILDIKGMASELSELYGKII